MNNLMKMLPTLSGLVACAFAFTYPTMGQNSPTSVGKPAQVDRAVPEEFRPLYQSLDETLHQDRLLYPFVKGNPCPLVAPNLFLAASIFAPSLPDSQRWKDLLDTLDAYRAMKTNAVLVQIMAPDLTFGDPGPLIDYYQRLAREVRARNMKLYVEHFVNIPFKANRPANRKDREVLQNDPQGKQELLKILEQEVTLIYTEIKPDYLSVLTEPDASIVQGLHLSFSAEELSDWVGKVATRLKSTGASPNTLLGAGATTVEPEEFVLKFVQQTSLDYIDLHLYFLKFKGEDQVSKFAMLVRKIRETRQDMKVTIGEAWLCKIGKEGPAATIQEAFFRDNFSFWGPLDEQFLGLLLGIAEKLDVSVVVPYFSQFFFTYYTFGDSDSSKLPPWPGSVAVSWNRALESIRSHQVSTTGKALTAMLDDRGK
jgi:hypothetical protein